MKYLLLTCCLLLPLAASSSLPADHSPPIHQWPTLTDCLLAACFHDPDSQCLTAEHPYGMPGVCVIVPEDLRRIGHESECRQYRWDGDYCNSVASYQP